MSGLEDRLSAEHSASNRPPHENDQQQSALDRPSSSEFRKATDTSEPTGSRVSSRQHHDTSTDGHSMRPPILPAPKSGGGLQYQLRGESSQPPAPSLPPGSRQSTRLASTSMQSMDRLSGSSDSPYSPYSEHSYRSLAPAPAYQSIPALGPRHHHSKRAAPPIFTSDNEREQLHNLRTAPLAPPPKLSELPQHSSRHWQYKLIIRQQPQQGRLCGLGSKDKRPLDPLPILQLRIISPDGTEDEEAENSSNLVLQVSLYKEDPVTGTHTEAVLVETNDPSYPWTRMLEGRLVASANVARDLDGSRACFFVFTDLSIRQEGPFRLAFKLLALGPPSMGPASASGHILAEALTEPFTIYSPRRFPGMTESTELAKCLARQGIQVPVRNDIRKRQEQPDSLTASTDDMNNVE
ncbi:hypothetical protein PHSY_007508 [Pseudozyma hubeiensis SY62]|uniref:Velvet domain-containing protein n=1 Tax=Pseudozyma hubeiensis (strain SY62) TaxID=1305764 RepID=R9PP80_PSEHS|nr:hypothetical protein PHSY_007508 [Pseudozyma hubeiensis SY62]GAC99905.1 hypothetical protein PHSY_007508 [Pseudozyma hubeiensis SY62]